MPYTPIPEEDLPIDSKSIIMPPGGGPEKTKELLRQLPLAKVFGLLLSADTKSALAEVVRTRWSELHHLSGEEFVVVAFDAPNEWTPLMEEYWKQHLGDRFDEIWGDWQKKRGLEAGSAFEWRDLFDPPIASKDLPCLVLFTDLESKQAVVRPIPDWDADTLYRFLMAQFDAVRSCCAQPLEERLACLKASVGSTGGKLHTYTEHFAETAWHYLKEHPTTVAMTTVNLLVALATANVIPLTGKTLAILKVVKDLFGKS
ncbi:MAG: hypothetical protein PHI97_03215 [Desulfobulbus sp.]|nr:hypothetical protein [Desulfobulbus sp.]